VSDPATSVRVYYHAVGTPEEYYEEMRLNPGGGYWEMLPIPKGDTKGIIYRIQETDADGKVLSSLEAPVPVTNTCPLVVPTSDESKFANNLVIGQTADKQTTVPPGFKCDGIVSKITVAGDLKSNDECRKYPAGLLIGAAALGLVGAGVAVDEFVVVPTVSTRGIPPPVSQARP
jgi:hypothetical protein